MKPTIVAIITMALLASVIAISLGSDATGWQLDNANSRISFVSTKAKDVAEVHRFTAISGTVTEEGTATVAIQLASVDTMIDIRNDRMRNMLFQVAQFPEATITGQVDVRAIRAMHVGDIWDINEELLIDLHGHQQTLVAELRVTKLAANTVQVASLKPIIANAASFGLSDGVEQLRQAAGLPSISLGVPVSLVLTFKI